MSEHWGSHNIEKDTEVTPGKNKFFRYIRKRIYFSKGFFFLYFHATSIFELLFFFLLFISFSMKVLFVLAVKEKVWKETDDASKKEYRR